MRIVKVGGMIWLQKDKSSDDLIESKQEIIMLKYCGLKEECIYE